MRFSILLLSLAFLIGCNQPNSTKETSSLTPNIVLIVADDLGYPYAGFMGDTTVQTPNLDKLASLGTVFTTGMVTESHCAPSLRTIITGLHCEEFDRIQEEKRILVRDSATSSLSQEDSTIWEQEFQWKSMTFFKTLPKFLAEKGYASFQGGKWWEFNYQSGGFTHGMSTGWTKEDRKSSDFFYKLMGNDGLKLGRVTNQPVFDFVEEVGEKPFFVWYAPDLPHYPLNAPQKYYDIYKDQNLTESAKRYYANASWFDDEIGEVMRYFEEKGLMENTLFLYVNDNGWDQEPDAEYRNDSLRWHNGGPKGKGSYYDLTFRTPIIFTWKGTLPEGQVKHELISSMDLLPTVLDYIDIQKPGYLSGVSLKENISGESDKGRDKVFGKITQLYDPNTTTFMGEPAYGFWMRTPKYHFVWDMGNEEELLFDMEKDPKNNHNIALENKDLISGFKEEIKTWKAEMKIE